MSGTTADATSTSSSNIVYKENEFGQRYRQGHLLSLNTFSGVHMDDGGERQAHPFWLGKSVSLYLGWRDFDQRRGDILPHLPLLLEGCDFRTTLEIRDTQGSPRAAVDQLLEAALSEDQQLPFGLLGALFSFVTQPLTTLASGFSLPQISGTSTSTDLDGADLFARTIPTNAQDARAVMTYFKYLGVRRAASIFVNEAYGIQFNKALQREADLLDIQLIFFPLDPTMDEENLLRSMQELKDSQVTYVVSTLLEQYWEQVFRAAVQQDVLGNPDYFWLSGEDMPYLRREDFALNPTVDGDLIRGLHGLGNIVLELESPYQDFFHASYNEFRTDLEQQEDFLSKMPERHILTNSNISLFQEIAEPFLYDFMLYDSVISMGLAACNASGLFTGEELYAELLQTMFEGVSGNISFDPHTGTRNALSTRYRVYNLLISQNDSISNETRLDAIPSALVLGDMTMIQTPFMYNGNTTVPPMDLPPLEYDYNLIPVGAQAFGLGIGAVVMLLSVGLMVWTGINRKAFIVNAAQPLFLAQLCLGCLVLASSVIPMSMQGVESSTPSLNAACCSIPWLLYMGFMLSISAIISKMWRLEQVMGGANNLRRVQVSSTDVIKPFVAMLVINVTCLVCWTVLSPWEYVRTEVENQDEFGRNTESYGRCRATNDWFYLFGGIAGATNAFGFFFAAYECYKVRNITEYFSETMPLTWSLASFLETCLLGGPILLVVNDSNPTAFFLVASALVCICCLCFLVPIYYFKIYHKDSSYKDAREDTQRLKRHQERRTNAEDKLMDIALDSSSATTHTARLSSGVMSIHRSSALGDSSHLSRLSYFGAPSGGSNKRPMNYTSATSCATAGP